MRRVWSAPAGLGPRLSGAALRSPGAFGRILLRALALAIPLAALFAFLLTRPDPSPDAPSPSLSSAAGPSVPSIHPTGPSLEPGWPAANLPSVEAPDIGAPAVPSIDSGGGGGGAGSGPNEEQDTGPRVVRERVHEHDYRIDIQWSWLMIFAALLALLLLFLLPINMYTVLLTAAGCSLALWLGIEFVYAGDFPETFGSRDSYFRDGVKHIVATYHHTHPVNVRAPLVLFAFALGAWSGRGLWRLYRRPRHHSVSSHPSTATKA